MKQEIFNMRKVKKIIILTMTFIMLAASVCMADMMVANKTEFRSSATSVLKDTKYNYAKLTLTKGPDRSYCTMYVYVAAGNNSKTYRTEQKTLSTTCKNLEIFYKDPFYKAEFMGRKYRVYAKISPSSYYTTVNVDGSLIP